MEYTKGPWKYVNYGKHWNNNSLNRIEIQYGEDGECIADTVYEDADARLISAAPDMYEALKDIVALHSGMPKSCGHTFHCVCPWEKAHAALLKAEGKE